MYKLYIKRMDGQKWFKEATIEEIESFKEEMSNTAKEIKDIPFPSKQYLQWLQRRRFSRVFVLAPPVRSE